MRKVSRFEEAEHKEQVQLAQADERRDDPRYRLVASEEWPELGPSLEMVGE